MTLPPRSARSDFDLAGASAYTSELVEQKLKLVNGLGLIGTVDDMLISLTQIHFLELINPETFLYLAVDLKQRNLAIVRNAAIKQCAPLR